MAQDLERWEFVYIGPLDGREWRDSVLRVLHSHRTTSNTEPSRTRESNRLQKFKMLVNLKHLVPQYLMWEMSLVNGGQRTRSIPVVVVWG